MTDNLAMTVRGERRMHLDHAGLCCGAGGFHIDPTAPADLAVITHAHADHALPGSRRYLAAASCLPLLRWRLGADINIQGLGWGETVRLGNTRVSLHPAGHILGSAQVRVVFDDGAVWVCSGDFKRSPDPTTPPFEVLSCDVFITETTFALPIYRWPEPQRVVADIHQWWQDNRNRGRISVLLSYALGKTQRILAGLAEHTDETVMLHGAMLEPVDLYRRAGIPMPPTEHVGERRGRSLAGALVLAPPSAAGSAWMKRFPKHVTGFVSGWMQVRGNRRWRGYDRGFVMSDHADWPELLRTFDDVGARQILTHHGDADTLIRYLGERGRAAARLN